ncbi:restriction endonuclease [Kitasatospora sp. NPDC090091]|uniref:restriction endonuclease n=1 Tax=Kitasatospora sp. NPDC090091 TaxID=3364081 RepID=UPI0038085C2D
MIIDRDARVVPPRSSHRAISRAMGRLIGKSDRDDQLRAFLWVGQCRIARGVEDGWEGHIARLERELSEARRRESHRYEFNEVKDFQRSECRGAASDVCEQVRAELDEACEALEECRQAQWLTSTALDDLAPLDHQLSEAVERLDLLLSRDRERLHLLALREEYYRRRKTRSGALTLGGIDVLKLEGLTRLVRDLLKEDGWTELSEHPSRAGIIVAQSEAGHTAAVCVQGSMWPEKERGFNVAAIQRARQMTAHLEADAVVMVRNGVPTRPGRRYAQTHAVTLVDRDTLMRWAVWRFPLDISYDDSWAEVGA